MGDSVGTGSDKDNTIEHVPINVGEKTEFSGAHVLPLPQGNDSLSELSHLATRYPLLKEIDNGKIFKKLSLAALDPYLARAEAIKKFGELIEHYTWIFDDRFRSSFRIIVEKVVSKEPRYMERITMILACYPWEGEGDQQILRQLVSIFSDYNHIFANFSKNLIENLDPRRFLDQSIRFGKPRLDLDKVIDDLIGGHPWMVDPRCLAAAVFVAQLVNITEYYRYDPYRIGERILALIDNNFDVHDSDDQVIIERIIMIAWQYSSRYDPSIRNHGNQDVILAVLEKFVATCGNDAAMRDSGLFHEILKAAEASLSDGFNTKFIMELFGIRTLMQVRIPSLPACDMDWLMKLVLALISAAGRHYFLVEPVFETFLEAVRRIILLKVPAADSRRICEMMARCGEELLWGRLFPLGFFRSLIAYTWPSGSRKRSDADIEEFLSIVHRHGLIVRDIQLRGDLSLMGSSNFNNQGIFFSDYVFLLLETNPDIDNFRMVGHLEAYAECLEFSSGFDTRLFNEELICVLLCRLIIYNPGYGCPENCSYFIDAAKKLIRCLSSPELCSANNHLAYHNFIYQPQANTSYRDAISIIRKYGHDRSILGSLVLADPGLMDPDNREKLARCLGICISAQEEADREYRCGYIIVNGLACLLETNPAVLAEIEDRHLIEYMGLFMKFAKMTVARGLGDWAQTRFELVADLMKNNPVIADPMNIGPFTEIIQEYVDFILHRFDPVYLHEYILKPLFEREPDLLLAENLNQLKERLEPVRRFLDRGMMPLCLDADEGRLLAWQRRRDELACGSIPDPASEDDINLFYSILFGGQWEPDHYEKYRKSINDLLLLKLQTIPLAIECAVITGEDVRPLRGEPSDWDTAIRYRDQLVSLYNNPLKLADEVELLAQLNKGERDFILRNLDAPAEALRGLASRLMFRQLGNYQPQIASFIEKVLILIALRESTDLRNKLAGPDVVEALFATRDLLAYRVREILEDILPGEYFAGLIEKIESETGCRILKGEFAHVKLRKKIEMLSKECRIYGHIVGLKKKLAEAAAITPDRLIGTGFLVPIEVNTIPHGEELLLLEGFRLNTEVICLAVNEEREPVKYKLDIENFNFPYLLSRHRMDLVVEEGIFRFDSAFDDIRYPHVDSVQSIQRLDPAVEAKLRRNSHVIKNRILPLLMPITKESAAMIDVMGRALRYYYPLGGGRDEFIFLPAKDWTLAFRHAVSHDCSRKMLSHLLHPSSFFFKIIHRSRWCGYLMLVEVRCQSGGRALAIDVINVETSDSVDWGALMRGFVRYLAPAARRNGYRYILMTATRKYISNSEFISRSIHSNFRYCRVIPRDEFSIDPPDGSFQSLDHDFRVVWETDRQNNS
ncbi:MAG TPA: hypothetical protein PK846_19390 [Spirochaetota bacterium]|nr:hypothetical protein [Spirochaetota bacterium]